jgi:hypothetical protein
LGASELAGRADQGGARRALVVAAATAVWLTVLAVAGLHLPIFGHEWHSIETVRKFGQDMGLETLRTYDRELAAPLAFALYAWWGRMVGFELPRLRLLSLVMAFVTVMAVYALARRVLRDDRDVLLAVLFFALHPYTIGLSVFVYNDILAILCAALLGVGIASGRPPLILLGSTAGLLTRQYLAFLTAAALGHYAIRWLRWRRSSDLVLLAGLLGSCLPLGALLLWWGGLGPASRTRALYLSGGLAFTPPALILYVTQLFTYLCPLLLLRRPRVWAWQSRRQWLWIGGVSLVYWVAPLRPAAIPVATGIDTVGLLHRAVRATVGRLGVPAEDGFFWIAFGLGLAVASAIGRQALTRRAGDWPDTRVFLALAVACFLAVMPLLYMYWEKYFMPLLPLVGVLVLAIREDGLGGSEIRSSA